MIAFCVLECILYVLCTIGLSIKEESSSSEAKTPVSLGQECAPLKEGGMTMIFTTAESIKYRPDQCPSCMYFYASINRCGGFKRGGMNAMFEGETSDPCPKYRVADFDGIVKEVNEEHKTAVFYLGDLDVVFGGMPVFEVPSEAVRERLRSSIGGSPVSFSVRNGEVVEVKQKEAGVPEKEIRELARSAADDSLVKLARMASQAVSTNDFDTFSTIRSELRTHVDMDRFIHAIRTHLSKSEQVAILNALQGENCTHCGSKFYEPKTMMDKVDFDAMQKVRVGCSKCGTAVCFSCAATAAGQRGKEGNCFCPKCGAELGRGGEAGELGEHFSGWN